MQYLFEEGVVDTQTNFKVKFIEAGELFQNIA